jgi:hypothetical protein
MGLGGNEVDAMKTSRFILIVATVAGTSLMAMVNPACAQQQQAEQARSGAARFDFAPNYFKREQTNAPLPEAANKGAGHNGSVPKGGSSVLGINSKLLEKPTVVQTTVAATPSFTQPTPATPPTMPPASSFGKPVSPAVAHANAGNFGKPGATAKPSSLNSDKQVSGKLLHRPMHYRVPVHGMSASPKSLDSYGNGFGYSPGPMVQSSTPAAPGNSSTQDVYGKLLRK